MSSMRFHSTTAALLLAAALAAPPASAQGPGAAAPPIIPGYWESTNRVLSPIKTKKVERRCLKPADIDKFLAGPSNRHYDCTYPVRVVEHGRIRMVGSCEKRKHPDGRKIEVAGEGYYTPTSFHLTARIATELFGVPISGRASTEARRLGDACPVVPDEAGNSTNGNSQK
jgi:hypothetical protein